MIKPPVQADSWNVPARTRPAGTLCAPEFGDVTRRNLWVRVVLVPWLWERGGEPDCVIWPVLGLRPGWREQIAGTLHVFSCCQL